MAFMDYTPFGALSNWLYQDPSKGANNYLSQIPDTIKPYFQPYIDAGGRAMPTLEGQYNTLINDPTHVMNQIGAGYQQSPGYQFALQQGLQAGNASAAAGGQAGTPMAQQNASNFAANAANQDYNNYVNRGLSQYQSGLSGLSGINQMGFQASSGLAEDLAQALMSQAALSYAGANGRNQSRGGMFGSLTGLVGSLFGS